jgi:pimeloyl-ACP methyl ester carboxylesterase
MVTSRIPAATSPILETPMDSTRRQLLLAGMSASVSAAVIGAAPALAAPALRTLDIEANGLSFHALEAGEGPLALCLHGFPDSAWTYRHLLPELARAGYRAVAPFMRGYAPTAIPADGDFSTRALAADASGLHAALGGDERSVLIAHDWGSAAAYGSLIDQPGRWRRAAVMNVPPWGVFGQIAFRYDQLKRSFYFWLFQMGVAESIVGANDLAFIEGLWRDWSPGFDPSAELPRVKACLRDPAHLRAALGYYRDFFAPDRFGTPAWAEAQTAVLGGPVTRPTLYLHGTQDGCIALDATGADAVRAALPVGSEVERIARVGHFMLVEAPRQVNGRILRFLGPA